MGQMLRVFATAVLLVAALLPPPAAAQAGDSYLDFLLARRLEQDGDVDGAKAALQRAATADPDSAELRAELAALHMRQNEVEAADKVAHEALSRDPGNIEAHRVLGLIYAAYAESATENGQDAKAPEFTRKAVEHLEKVSATHGGATDVNVQFNLGRLYLRAGDSAKAIERLSRVLEQNPYSMQARLSLAQAFGAAGRNDEAAQVLAAVVDDEPRLATALGQYYERAGKSDEAARAYARALAANPKDLRALLALSREHSLKGEYDEAIETLTKAQGLVPNDAGIAAFLAQTYLQAKRYSEASAFAAAAQKKFPDDLRFTRLHARALFDTGNQSAALALVEAAVRQHPDDSGVYLSLADLYTDAGRPDEALKTLENAAKRFPEEADVLNYLGYVLADRGVRLDESVRLITRALELDPDNHSYIDSLGWAHFKRGDLAQAETYLAKAAEGLPRNSVVQDHYGDLLAKRGRLADAVAAWNKALGGDGEDIERAAIEKKIKNAKSKMQNAK
jgi:tetratricopeptide (TPR) repeat protein